MMANIEIYVTKCKNTEDSYHSYYIITTALVNKQSITQHLSMWVKKLATLSVSASELNAITGITKMVLVLCNFEQRSMWLLVIYNTQTIPRDTHPDYT